MFFSTVALSGQTLFFHESFDDANLSARGWYDNIKMVITPDEHIPNSFASVEFKFYKGSKTPTQGGGIRRLIPESEEVYLNYWIKYSTNWVGSRKPYHPHEFHFITNENDKWVGPSYTHLTAYIEQNGGKPMLSIQDGQNIEESAIGIDLQSVTENRSVAGCNGTSDSYPSGDCYLSGNLHMNGKTWKSEKVCFSNNPGDFYKNDWHFAEAYFKLNSIQNGKGMVDGVLQYWFDGIIIIDVSNATLRTGKFPNMKFNQFLIAPYIGDGSPVEQTMWIDEITVASSKMLTRTNGIDSYQDYLKIFPNPFHSGTTIQFSIKDNDYVTLKIIDNQGIEIDTLINRMMEKGTYEVIFYNGHNATGALFCRLQVGNSVSIKKMIVKPQD